jgi:hypothetical protein
MGSNNRTDSPIKPRPPLELKLGLLSAADQIVTVQVSLINNTDHTVLILDTDLASLKVAFVSPAISGAQLLSRSAYVFNNTDEHTYNAANEGSTTEHYFNPDAGVPWKYVGDDLFDSPGNFPVSPELTLKPTDVLGPGCQYRTSFAIRCKEDAHDADLTATASVVVATDKGTFTPSTKSLDCKIIVAFDYVA